jgi:hypothetical protein
MATYPVDPNPPVRPIIIGTPIVDPGKLTAADIGISPEVAQVLQDWAAKERQKLELLLLVARLRELTDRKARLETAAWPLRPKPTPQYLQLHGQIAQIAKKLAQAGVYATPEEAVRDAEGWRNQTFPIERFQGQPVVGMETQPLRYSLYTAMWGAEDSGIIDRVEQALANAAARRPLRPARNQK